MKLIVIRHALTEENKSGILSGNQDGKLSKEGLIQAKKLAERLKNTQINFIYSSDIGRTKLTVEAILSNHPDTQVIYDPLLRETNKGIFEGKTTSEIINDYRKSGLSYYEYRPSGGESHLDLSKRVEVFLDRILKDHKENETILICTHNTWIRALIGIIKNTPQDNELRDLNFHNTSVSIFEINKKQKEIILTNCIKHLKKYE